MHLPGDSGWNSSAAIQTPQQSSATVRGSNAGFPLARYTVDFIAYASRDTVKDKIRQNNG